MKQRYTEICNNPENLYMLPHEYSSKLVMFYIEPRLGQNKIIHCYSLNELMPYLHEKTKILRHSPVEVKYNFRTGNATETEMKEFLSFKNEQLYNHSNWIYLLPTGTFVDSSFVDCINDKRNTIKLTVSEQKIYVYRNKASAEGISAMTQMKTDIYKAEPVDRCSVLNELKLDFKCDESNVFLEDEIIETIEEPVNQWIGNIVNETIDSAWSQSTAASQRREREQKQASQQGYELVYKIINGVEVKEHVKKDEDKRIVEISRYVGENFFSNADIPSLESFEYKISDEGKYLTTRKKWFNGDGLLHREAGPAFIGSINDKILTENWFFEGNRYRDDPGKPTTVKRYYPSGRLKAELWENDEDSEAKYLCVYYYDNENNSIIYRVEYPSDTEMFILEGFYKNGNKKYRRDDNNLVVYADKDLPTPMLTINRTTNKLVQLTSLNDIVRVIENFTTTLMNNIGKIRTITNITPEPIGEGDKIQTIVSVVDYKQENNDCYNRVSRNYYMYGGGLFDLLYYSNLKGNNAVIVRNKDGSISQEIDYNNYDKIHTLRIGGNPPIYTVGFDANGNKVIQYDEHDRDVRNFKVENKNGEIKLIGEGNLDRLKRFTIDLDAIEKRDAMRNKYILQETEIIQKFNLILNDWDDAELLNKDITILLIVIKETDQLGLFDNCAEYDPDPYTFEGPIENELYTQAMNMLDYQH